MQEVTIIDDPPGPSWSTISERLIRLYIKREFAKWKATRPYWTDKAGNKHSVRGIKKFCKHGLNVDKVMPMPIPMSMWPNPEVRPKWGLIHPSTFFYT